MPVTFAISSVLSYDQYGKFIAVSPPSFDIPASDAVSVTADDTNGWLEPYNRNQDKAVDVAVPIPSGWGAVVERFNWGGTSRPDKVFYEIWVEAGPLSPFHIEETFHCCGVITDACVDNRSTHPSSGLKITFRIWNRTASPGMTAEDVHVELAGWMYKFRLEYLDEVKRMSAERQVDVLEEIRDRLSWYPIFSGR